MNLGIIGCGNIVEMHVRHVDRTPVRPVCVMDVAAEKAEAMAGKLGCAWTADRGELLSREDVEAVLIATPNDDHAASSIAALRAGKHVLCEKPIVRTLDEGAEVVREARGARAIFQSAFMRRQHPGYRRLRELVRGEIGEIQHVRVRNTDAVPADSWIGCQSGRRWIETTGGYLVLSGCHSLDIMRWILGEPERVFGRTRSWTDLRSDIYSTAVFDYSGFQVFYDYGVHRVLRVGDYGNGWEDTWEVTAEKARVHLSMPKWDRYEQDRPILRIHWGDGRAEEPPVPTCDYYEEQLRAFAGNVEEGRASPDVTDGFRAQALVEAIRASSDAGRSVEVEEFYARAE